MQGGKLRHRVTITKPGTPTSDGMGGTTLGDDIVVATVWASVEGLSARERDQARAVESVRSHTVVIRYRDDVDETCTIQDGGHSFRVNGVSDLDGRRRELQLACAEVGSDG